MNDALPRNPSNKKKRKFIEADLTNGDSLQRTLHANRIKEMRDARGLNRKDVAAALGCSETQIYKLEHGDVPVTLEWLYRLAEAFGCRPEEILAEWQESAAKIDLIARAWVELEPGCRVEALSRIRAIDPDASGILSNHSGENTPRVEITIRPDGTYRRVEYVQSVPLQETANPATPDKRKKKDE